VLGATLLRGNTIAHSPTTLSKAYLVPSQGRVVVNGIELSARDGVAFSGEPTIDIAALEDAELVLVETA
jgi:hypothetical protein